MFSMVMRYRLFAFLLCWLSGVSSQSPVKVCDSKQNLTYVGYAKNGVDQFQGIRYGQDTSGVNRFKHPIPYSYPSGAQIDATNAGASCPQKTTGGLFGASFETVYTLSEDCLNLRIARPSGLESGAGVPVMVWIYGGE